MSADETREQEQNHTEETTDDDLHIEVDVFVHHLGGPYYGFVPWPWGNGTTPPPPEYPPSQATQTARTLPSPPLEWLTFLAGAVAILLAGFLLGFWIYNANTDDSSASAAPAPQTHVIVKTNVIKMASDKRATTQEVLMKRHFQWDDPQRWCSWAYTPDRSMLNIYLATGRRKTSCAVQRQVRVRATIVATAPNAAAHTVVFRYNSVPRLVRTHKFWNYEPLGRLIARDLRSVTLRGS